MKIFIWSQQGLEVIEAHYLFGAEYDDIEIVIHPQSIVHSMIETQVRGPFLSYFQYIYIIAFKLLLLCFFA